MAFEKKPNEGAIFRNKQKTKDTQPGGRGSFRIECPHCKGIADFWVSAFTKEPKGGGDRFQALKMSAMDDQPTQPGKTPISERPAARPPARKAAAPAEDDDVPMF